MGIKRINQSALDIWVDELIKEQTVYGVQAKEDKFAFDRTAGSLFLWFKT